MGVKYEDACVGCPQEIGCMGSACPYRNVAVYVCDQCGDELGEDIYEVDGDMLCEDCLKAMFIRK